MIKLQPVLTRFAQPPSQVPSESQGHALEERAQPLAGIRVLVVEDDEDTREVLVEFLRDMGAQVHAASSAPDGLVSVLHAAADVVLSDIAMPGMDGYDLIRAIRRLGANEGGRRPASALTAHCSSEDRLVALRAGYSMHLSKPVDLGVLVRSITAVLAKTA